MSDLNAIWLLVDVLKELLVLKCLYVFELYLLGDNELFGEFNSNKIPSLDIRLSQGIEFTLKLSKLMLGIKRLLDWLCR
jgi:hypothetical protein